MPCAHAALERHSSYDLHFAICRFCARYGMSTEDFEVCLVEHGWADSERAQRYSLFDETLGCLPDW